MRKSATPPRVCCLLSFALLSLAACQHKPDPIQAITLPPGFGTAHNPVLVISYEFESINHTETPDQTLTKLDFLYRNRAKPEVTRSRVETDVFADGTSQWTITKLEPRTRIPTGREGIPPDDSPQTKVTRIMGNQAHFYDANGKLLHQQPMQMPSFAELVKQVKEGQPPAVAASGVLPGGGGSVNVRNVLEQAQRIGATVTDLGHGMLSIRYSSQPTGFRSARTATNDLATVNLIDSENGLLMASSLYDANQELVQRMMFKYKPKKPKELPVIEIVRQEVYGKHLKTNKAFVNITTTAFEGMKIVSNFAK